MPIIDDVVVIDDDDDVAVRLPIDTEVVAVVCDKNPELEDIYAPDGLNSACSTSIEILEDISLGNLFANVDADADVVENEPSANVDVNGTDVNESTGAAIYTNSISVDEYTYFVGASAWPWALILRLTQFN